MISFEVPNGGNLPPLDHRRARLVVLHTLSGYVLSRVRIATREALIPDLERIEAELATTLASEA